MFIIQAFSYACLCAFSFSLSMVGFGSMAHKFNALIGFYRPVVLPALLLAPLSGLAAGNYFDARNDAMGEPALRLPPMVQQCWLTRR